MASPFALSDRVTLLPVVHGSGDFAIEVRRIMLEKSFSCLAVPLPECFQSGVEAAIDRLPLVSVVYQQESTLFAEPHWQPELSDFDSGEDDPDDDDQIVATYVPIDPCQPVIAALRIALQERIPRAFIDADVDNFEIHAATLPDPYAVRTLHAEAFASATLPVLSTPLTDQLTFRAATMAQRLRELESRYDSILAICSYSEWLEIKRCYQKQEPAKGGEFEVETPVSSSLAAEATMLFLLGELPHITGQYELARQEIDDDENLSVDGIKQLLLSAKNRYLEEHGRRARPVTPKLLALYLRYVRNLALIERRLTPDLYTLIVGARQILGDQFAINLAELAREYPFIGPLDEPRLTFGIDEARLPDGDIISMKSRLPGPPVTWRSCELQRKPSRSDQTKWKTTWNSYSQCSWPPEDQSIERFRSHVKDHALSLLGADLARTEKFTTSLKDGLDIRETLRNWHTGDLYVKENPPTKGGLDCVVMLFDSPADPREYPHRITWHAEHQDESTLAFFSTDFFQEMVGPGIALGSYGGAMFLFPPRPIPDIWRDRRFDFVDTLEERLIVAGCHHSRERQVALLSERPPGIAWKKLARRYGKKIIHVPLQRFSQQMLAQLRMFHVLNGQEVRSYAANFIRKA